MARPARQPIHRDRPVRRRDRARRGAGGELGLSNLDLRQADLDDARELGTFDFVVAHGVYSRIEGRTRRVARGLPRAPRAGRRGLLSYDAFPAGTCARSPARCSAGTCATSRPGGPDRPGKGAAGRDGRAGRRRPVCGGGQPSGRSPQSDAALYHDELAANHEAMLFTDFAAHAARHGLRYLAEADLFDGGRAAARLSRRRRPRARAVPRLLRGRLFRQTLLCHAPAPAGSEPAPVIVARHARGPPACKICRASSARGGSSSAAGAAARSPPTTSWSARARAARRAWPRPVPVAEPIDSESTAPRRVLDAAAGLRGELRGVARAGAQIAAAPVRAPGRRARRRGCRRPAGHARQRPSATPASTSPTGALAAV